LPQSVAFLHAVRAIQSPLGPRQTDHQSLLRGIGGVVCLPESFQQFLELGRLFAEGVQSNLLRPRVKPMAQVGGADVLKAIGCHRIMGKLLVQAVLWISFALLGEAQQ